MLVELPAEELYAVIQAVGNYVLTGEECDCDTLLSRVVCNQLISTIDRKGQKAVNSARNLPDKKKKETKQTEAKESKYKDLPWEEYLKLFIKQHPSFNYDMDSDSFVSTYGDTLDRFQDFVHKNFCAPDKIPLPVLAHEITYYHTTGIPYSGE